MNGLRVIDAGTVPPLHSQALWHGIASAMGADDAPVLSFCRPASPYVGIGYHRRLDELDLNVCRADGLPVIRRQIGGGPVWLDADQLFFQLTLPVRQAPAGVGRLYEYLLTPAVEAFRSMGLDAHLDGVNDIAVADRRISGTGAGQIGDAVTVVGNVIFRFPHERMARVLSLPDEAMRTECLRLMRRHVSSLECEGAGAISFPRARAALQAAYAGGLDAEPIASVPGAGEETAIARWVQRLADPAWTAGPDLAKRPVRQVKVTAGAWVVHGHHSGVDVRASIVRGVVCEPRVTAAHLNGATAAIEASLLGARAERGELQRRMADFGDDGDAVVAALAGGLAVR